jgi:hypothetical protein
MSEPWTDRAAFPFLDVLERHATVFLDEVAALPANAFVPMPATDMYQGVWKVCALVLNLYAEEFSGLDLAANRRLAPRTSAILDTIPGLEVGGFLSLAPGASLDWHEDHREDDVIRAHLALSLPPDEQAYWPLGRARLLDIRTRHRAINPTPDPRLTLIVDVRMPFAVPTGVLPPWNP